ncbi:ParB/RepB/Spo0J family partition protein [Limnochorda pilosa]|uniref:Chromosome partitioning protein ParB n=1 Tax=Limnochorda pilosa TaxID=1555112 RepID=A0A0K2SP45_LIMPI|nr:ParB/RepB/Spo0J family partition protein [Limnochorda pilosa]BAS28876.1 chromosome partitioning protein ParB [Limnochorda pilosa]
MPELRSVPMELIDRDPGQPRTRFDARSLDSLARSFREVGQLQPVLVRRAGNRYRLVAGERRWRAALQVGQREIQVLVLEEGSEAARGADRLLQLVENLQREDLDPLERATAIQELMKAEGLSQRAVAQRLGVPRTTLVDWLDLLRVEPRFQQAVAANARGEDVSLSLSHVNEALALASRRQDPVVASQVLDLALAFSLSKGQMRKLCALMREAPDLEPEDALRKVLAAGKPGRPADLPGTTPEAHLQRLVESLERSSHFVERLSHVSSRFLAPDVRAMLVQRFEQLHRVTGEALERLSATPEEAAARAKEERKQRQRAERRRRKEKGRQLA